MDLWQYIYSERYFKWDGNFLQNAKYGWLICVLAGMILARWKSPVHRRLLLFVTYSFLMEYISGNNAWQALLSHKGNSPIYHLLTPGLLFVMIYQFYPYLFNGKFKLLRWVLPLGFTLLTIINAIYINGFYKFPSLTAGLYAFTGIGVCLGYLLYLLRNLTVERLEMDPIFWFAASGLVYYSGSVLLLASVEFIIYDLDFFRSMFKLLKILTLLLNVSIIIAFLIPPGEASKKLKTIS